jgi:hypothetical protein
MNSLSANLKPQNQISKLFFLCALILIFRPGFSAAQDWCIPTITETFNQGISGVSLNGTPPIERVSGRTEGYVNTGLSTTLARGQSYTVTLIQGFGVFCSAGNLRVWIDFNRDYDFNDSGELVLSLNQQSSTGPFNASFTVPSDAFLGTARMRVTSKMMESCGHTPPTPCNVPPDPIGYHGEMEDFDIIITNVTGITNITFSVPDKFGLYQNYPNPFNPVTEIKFDVAKAGDVSVVIYNVTGAEAQTLVKENLQAGTYKTEWNASNFPSGVYYYKITAGNFTETRKMVLVK